MGGSARRWVPGTCAPAPLATRARPARRSWAAAPAPPASMEPAARRRQGRGLPVAARLASAGPSARSGWISAPRTPAPEGLHAWVGQAATCAPARRGAAQRPPARPCSMPCCPWCCCLSWPPCSAPPWHCGPAGKAGRCPRKSCWPTTPHTSSTMPPGGTTLQLEERLVSSQVKHRHLDRIPGCQQDETCPACSAGTREKVPGVLAEAGSIGKQR
ncbi:uncharacterized protein LOC115271329, partial [Terrapene carolina triunguis]|uniref:uncharacterized protein LOC115271329 n=1 Tax=Terrapene triunguis TaxID=2587831 RepID=UPI0011566B72